MAGEPVEFRMLGEIGRGGFCFVEEIQWYDPEGNEVGPRYAIKRILPEHIKDSEVLARFQREARLMDDVLTHPNIVGIEYRNLSDADPYFVMLRADENLADQLAAGRWQDEDWVIDKFRQILEAMAYAHEKGVIHRDLKPQNALLFGDRVQVNDFGLGKHLLGGTVGLTKTNVWSGTEPYMAPEQFTAMKDTGPEADVFSLGKLFMAMLIGQDPIVGQPDVSGLPERFRYFVSRCCSNTPENRFANAREALEALDRVIRPREFTETAEETLARLSEEWFLTPEGSDEELHKVREIDEHLRTHAGDEAMFTRAVPRLAQDLLDQYQDNLPADFGHMIAIYDDHVSGGLPFDYCDVVADFYDRIFRRTDDVDLRRRILHRLYVMGWSHNRWHVRGRLLKLLSEYKDAGTVAMAMDVINADPEAAPFLAETAANFDLPEGVRRAITGES
jgi:eukaryotic-like serine/threonine-protein kinase